MIIFVGREPLTWARALASCQILDNEMTNRFLVAAAMISVAGSVAHAATVTETVTGVIGGAQTRDNRGYFGKAGADLQGHAFKIALSYTSQDFNQSGTCRNNSCTYHIASGTQVVPQSVQVAITINGVTQTYAPAQIGAVFLSITSPPYFAIDSDCYSGFGGYGRGFQLNVQVMSNPGFGAPLSPGNPVLAHKTSYDNVLFFDASSQTATEQLSLNVRHSSK